MRKLRQSKVNTTGHKGNTKHPLYTTWKSMITRCYYSGAYVGIEVCPEWLDFNQFIKDVGHKPSQSHQLDRIDSNGNYCKENCRWSTPTENTINSRPRNGRKYKGVYQHKGRSNYFVMVTWQGMSIHCGSYATEEEAALCYNRYMLQYYGDRAKLNEIKEE